MSLSFTTNIKDPIWGDIPLTWIEQQLISTRSFQRLRHIKQMSLAYLGHHGAQHTRYEHSIGCCHVAYNLMRNIKLVVNTSGRKLHEIGHDDDEDRIQQTIRIAALLHDIGHAPMSHLVESVFKKYPSLIQDCLNDAAYNLLDENQKEIINNYGHEQFSVHTLLNDEEICGLLKSHDHNLDAIKYLVHGGGTPAPKFRVYKPIISGDLDADRLDYINRDFYFCGIREVVDLQLFAQSLGLYWEEGMDNPEIRIQESSVLAASSFLFARYRLAQMVHNDPSSRINEQAFVEIVRKYFDNLSPADRLKRIFDLHKFYTDYDLLFELRQLKIDVSPSATLGARDLVDGKAVDTLIARTELTVEDMHPIERYCLSLIASNSDLIRQLELEVRKYVQSGWFCAIDIISVKPSSMTLPIHVENHVGRKRRSLFDNYYMPHAVYALSFRNLSIRLLCNKDAPITLPEIINPLSRLSIDDDSTDSSSQQVPVDMTDMARMKSWLRSQVSSVALSYMAVTEELPIDLTMLIIMNAVKEHAREELDHHGTLWIKSDTNLHRFINQVRGDLDQGKDFIEGFDMHLFKASESLVMWGLIDHVHKPVPYGSDSSHGQRFVSRVDRMINQWGHEFVRELENRITNLMIDEIKKAVIKRQGEVAELLAKYREIQIDLDDKDVHEEYEELRDIESKIRDKGGCTLKFK